MTAIVSNVSGFAVGLLTVCLLFVCSRAVAVDLPEVKTRPGIQDVNRVLLFDSPHKNPSVSFLDEHDPFRSGPTAVASKADAQEYNAEPPESQVATEAAAAVYVILKGTVVSSAGPHVAIFEFNSAVRSLTQHDTIAGFSVTRIGQSHALLASADSIIELVVGARDRIRRN